MAILTTTADAMNLAVSEKLHSYMNYKICEDGVKWTHTGGELKGVPYRVLAYISPMRYGNFKIFDFPVRTTLCLHYT